MSGLPTAGRRAVPWIAPLAAGFAALAVFTTALWLVDVGPGPGMGGDVVGAAVMLEPSHAPGHPVQMVLAKAASLIPAGSIAFRVRLLSAVMVALSVVFVFGAALRVVREIAGAVPIAGPLVAAASAVAAGLSGPALSAAGSADAYALGALLGSVVLWACCRAGFRGDGTGPGSTGMLAVAGLFLGLAVADHAPSGLLLLPPVGLAAALVLASRQQQGADADSEAGAATRVSWLLLATVVGLVAVAALPLRSADLAEPAALARMFLSRSSVAAAESGGPPAGWLAAADPLRVLSAALGVVPLVVGAAALVAMVARRGTRTLGITVAGFLVGPTVVRMGIGIDRAPGEVSGYLVVPAFCVAIALAAPAALALRLAGRRDERSSGRAGAWRRRVVWTSALVLAAAALLRSETRGIDWGAARARDGATWAVADAVFETPPPDAALVVEQASIAALVRYEEAVGRRRPDLAILSVPRLSEPGYARSVVLAAPDLAQILAARLTPAGRAKSALAAAAERLASERPLLAEPGRTAESAGVRGVLPRGVLVEVLPRSAGRIEIGTLLRLAGRGPADPGAGVAALAGTALGSAVAWDLAGSAVVAARAAASLTPLPPDQDDPRSALRLEAVALARRARAAGAPAAVIDRLAALIDGPLAQGAVDFSGVLEADAGRPGKR